jgi:hypothetical protein
VAVARAGASHRVRKQLTAAETRQPPGAGQRHPAEVHGRLQARDARRAGVQGALHCRRLPRGARQQLPQRPVYGFKVILKGN